MSNKTEINLAERLRNHPILKSRVEAILDVAENTHGDLITADAAEQCAIEEVRKLGNEVLQDWAEERVLVSASELKNKEKNIVGNGKKKIIWHTTFGDIEVKEHLFIRQGKQFRPFSTSANVRCRGCSLLLQRAVVDFGADHAFGRVPEKLQEHYGITLAESTIRAKTEHHAKQMFEQEKQNKVIPDKAGSEQQIGQIDGSMIPIVSIDEESEDKRKNKKLHWKEARLSLVHEKGSVTPKFGVVFQGSVDDAGQSLLNAAVLADFGNKTQLHAVGDGASWIANQVKDKFGTQGSYLVDFYHVCDYLAGASTHCANDNEVKEWMKNQKNNLKNNQYEKVLNNLKPNLEADDIDDKQAPVRACHRYLSNRTDQLDYKTAIEKGLPIGSGEIESAHRYVIQERLKLAGAWWKADNADYILALRVIRANKQWNKYWEELMVA